MRVKSLSIVAAPAVEPVTLADALSFLRVDNAAESQLVSGLVATAREVVELYTGRALISQQWLLTMPTFEDGYDPIANGELIVNRRAGFDWIGRAPRIPNAIALEVSPLITVDSVKYYDVAETITTLAASNYRTLAYMTPGAVALKSTASWPAVFDRPDAVQITFTAGHGTTAATVPNNLRTAVLILAKHYYDGGRNFVDVAQAVKEIPMGARHMMESRRVEGWVS